MVPPIESTSLCVQEPILPVLLVLAGPAGSGKTTLCDRMVAEVPGFSRVITTTTRTPRPGEVDGQHYYFLTDEQFDAKIAAGEFLEWALVHKKHRRYGTLASSVLGPLAEGRSLVINIDVQGVDSFRRAAASNSLLATHMATVFISVPIPILRERMIARGQDDGAEIAFRLTTAEKELEHALKFEFLIESKSKDEDFAALLEVWRTMQERLRKRGDTEGEK